MLGFGPVSHPGYHDVSTSAPDLDRLMAWIRDASTVVGTDSAALHIAAGFDVPTLGVFVSIDPLLRARDYRHCRTVDLRTAPTDGLHRSDDPVLLREVQRIWRGFVARAELPWPEPVARPAPHRDSA